MSLRSWSIDEAAPERRHTETNPFRPRPVEKERGGRLHHILAQLLPVIPFGEDVFRQAFGAIAAVVFLYNFKDQFRHTLMIRQDSGYPNFAASWAETWP
jgi:hypothetical protein